MARNPSPFARRQSSPRISANDLARYMVAGETGKIGIIRRSRDAEPAITVRYSDVRRALRDYLSNAARTTRILNDIRIRFENRAEYPELSAWAREDARLSVDVLNSFARMENQIAGARFIGTPGRQQPLILSGVEVSVQLDIMAVRERGDIVEVGGVLFRMTKADEETDAAAAKRREMGAYAATLAFMQVQSLVIEGRQPHHALCASYDI